MSKDADPQTPPAGNADPTPAVNNDDPEKPEGKPDNTPPAGNADAQAAPAGEPNNSDDGDQPISLEEARKLRRENAGYRTKVREFEKAEQEREREKLSEAERLKAEREDFEKERTAFEQRQKDTRTHDAVTAAARKLGYRDPSDALRLLDESKLDLADDGSPTNAEQLLKELAESKDYLLGPTSGSGSPAAPAANRRGAKLTKEDLQRLTPAEVNARWDEVQELLKS